MKKFWDDWYPVIVLVAFFSGLLGQFIWKMIYFPEPIVPVIIELLVIAGLAGLAVWMVIKY